MRYIELIFEADLLYVEAQVMKYQVTKANVAISRNDT